MIYVRKIEYGSLTMDFQVSNQGTIFILIPLTDAAKGWVREHIPDDAQTWARGIVVEHRYIGPILEGIDADGLAWEEV
jgi:hypothetical protein